MKGNPYHSWRRPGYLKVWEGRDKGTHTPNPRFDIAFPFDYILTHADGLIEGIRVQ